MLKLPDDLHRRLTQECRYAAKRMSESPNVHEKLYYFSVFFGEATRVLNWHWDRDLALIWFMTQNFHNQVSAATQAMKSGEAVVTLTTEYFEALTKTTSDLVEFIEQKGTDEELNGIMGRFAELAYVITGNGYYLFQKGHISVG